MRVEIVVAIIGFFGTLALVLGKIIVARIFKKSGKEKNKERLMFHPFFSQIKLWEKSIPVRIKVSHPIKKYMIHPCMIILFTVFYEKFFEVVKNFYSNQDTYKSECVKNVFTDCVLRYEKMLLEAGIPLVFLNHFKEWNQPFIDIIYNSIENTIAYHVYDEVEEELNAILDMILLSLRLYFVNSVMTIKTLNGQLEKRLEEKYLQDGELKKLFSPDELVEIEAFLALGKGAVCA